MVISRTSSPQICSLVQLFKQKIWLLAKVNLVCIFEVSDRVFFSLLRQTFEPSLGRLEHITQILLTCFYLAATLLNSGETSIAFVCDSDFDHVGFSVLGRYC